MIGPKVIITNHGYGCSECAIGVPLNREDVDVFVVNSTNAVEYLDVADNQAHENILQAVRISDVIDGRPHTRAVVELTAKQVISTGGHDLGWAMEICHR